LPSLSTQSRLKPSQVYLGDIYSIQSSVSRLESLRYTTVKDASFYVDLSPLNASVWRKDAQTNKRRTDTPPPSAKSRSGIAELSEIKIKFWHNLVAVGFNLNSHWDTVCGSRWKSFYQFCQSVRPSGRPSRSGIRGIGRNFHWRRPSHGDRGARGNNGGLGAEPPAGSRGRAPGGGPGGEAGKPPWSWRTFQTLDIEKRQQICPVLAFWELELA